LIAFGGWRGDDRAVLCDPYPAIQANRSVDMCNYCRLTTPSGVHKVCHACAIAIRGESRRGLHAIEEYLGGWSELERWLVDEE
jgi:hypothetical protein